MTKDFDVVVFIQEIQRNMARNKNKKQANKKGKQGRKIKITRERQKKRVKTGSEQKQTREKQRETLKKYAKMPCFRGKNRFLF